jgi:hypothetical protein
VAVAAVAEEEPFRVASGQLTTLISFLQKRDARCAELVAQAGRLRSAGGAKGNSWHVKDDMLYKGKALYVPRDSAVCAQVMRMHYDDALTGYFGRAKTLELISRKYY